MPSELPPFSAAWINQWKNAAPRLQAIRDEELRRMGALSQRTKTGTPRIYDRNPDKHGMVIMQRWFTRRRLLELNAALLNGQTDRTGSA